MNQKSIFDLLKYLSLFFVISFFFFHNIYLVFCGIIISLYLINIKYINSYISYYGIRVGFLENKTLDNSIKIMQERKEEEESDDVSKLVEDVEELGYIPSLDRS
tara:strand:+ start:6358 stop:6669 length:312 start_codon:yes stop_codon:yes gene_type:complete